MSSSRRSACATDRGASPTSPRSSAWKATCRSPRTSSSTTSRARMITARSSAGIARPASAIRAAGIAPVTSARRRTSPPRSASPKRRRPSTEGAPMTSSLLLPIAAFVLAAASVGGVLFALFQPRFAGGSPLDRRVEAIAGPRVATVRVAEGTAEKARKRSVKSTLREADERQKGSERRKYKPSLAIRLRQADLSWNLRTYRLVTAGVGGALFVAWLAIVGPVVAAGLGGVGGPLLPHLYVGFRRRRRPER